MTISRTLFPTGFREYSSFEVCKSGSPVLVALSGGADSVALFDMTARLCERDGTHFFACHINHGIRGDEAIRDRDFCVSLAASSPRCKNIFVLNTDIPALASASGRSLELEARLARYEFFEKVMKENGISVLATAHNADDNLETLIFNLVRGSGARGMCGIPPVRALSEGRAVVRPLLEVSKAEILDYCEQNSLCFVTDSTNLQNDYSRNLIRNRVIPLLEEINPSLRVSASRLSRSMRQTCDYIETASKDAELSVSSLRSAHPACLPQIISNAISSSGFSSELEETHINSIRDIIENGRESSSVSLPNEIRAKISGGKLTFEKDIKVKEQYPEFNTALSFGENRLPDGSVLWILTDAKKAEALALNGGYVSLVEMPSTAATLTARSRRSGDRITVKGVNKSLKKLMCDQKLDPRLRQRAPLVILDGEILLIPGVAVSDRVFSKNGNVYFVWSI